MNIKYISKLLKETMDMVSLDASLFVQNPKEYLYLYTYSKDKCIEIKPYDPGSQIAADSLIKKIHTAAPELEVYFIGSASLHISGLGDIDLIAKSDSKEFSKYIPLLNNLFGKPHKMRKKFIEWHFTYATYQVELLMADPSTKNFQNGIQINMLLSKSKEKLREYI